VVRVKTEDILNHKFKTMAGLLQAKPFFRPDRFCLILGPPRSGTTALSIWLRGQPKAVGFNETRILVSLFPFIEGVSKFRRVGARRDLLLSQARHLLYSYYGSRCLFFGKNLLVDKEPLEPLAFPDENYLEFINAVKNLIPGAKFLFLLRDPISTVWSMTRRKWGYSIGDGEARSMSLEFHVNSWLGSAAIVPEIMDDPAVYVCQFHKLIVDTPRESERILSFLGVKNGMHFSPRPVKTPMFNKEEVVLIQKKTAPLLGRLKDLGITEI
jgi:hypothetical protein